MDEADVIKILEDHGAVIRNSHIVYTSGRHGSSYINKDAIYPDTRAVSALCAAIAEHFSNAGVQVVAAPAVGGVILSQWVAHHLIALGSEALAVYAEKDDAGSFTFRRGYGALLDRKRVLVVEDVITTGASLREVVRAVKADGGVVVGAAALCNRGAVTAGEIGNPPELFSLTEFSFESWEEGECPLCRQGTPVNTDVGKGREFLRKKQTT